MTTREEVKNMAQQFLVEQGRGAHAHLVAVVKYHKGYRQYLPVAHYATRAEAQAYVARASA